MKNMSFIKRTVSFITVISLLLTFITGCASKKQNGTATQTSENTTITTEDIAEIITESIQSQSEIDVVPLNFSDNWEDYIGNLDAFVYGAIKREYELVYNVFDAALELPDGSCIYGIGYTDFEDYYEADDGTGFFPAGFISLIGEPEIPEDTIETGLKIVDLDYDRSDTAFVYAYEQPEYYEHCVIWGQYLKYGVTGKGEITYSAESYTRGKCDESLGSLYSYDEDKYVYDPEVGNYISLAGISLNEEIDFKALEEEINSILDEQDKNFSKVDVETSVGFAREAVNAYLLSLQEESFMGYNVAELIEISKSLDPMECIRFTSEGYVIVDISADMPDTPDQLTKWLVGVSCGIVIASTIAADLFCPALTPLSGAVSGAAIEVFCQVLFENQTLKNVNWTKVAVASVSGALLSWFCPMLASKATKGVVNVLGNKVKTELISKLVGYAALTFSNAVVSGVTSASFSLIDGKESDEIFNSFLIGAAIGGSCTVVASALTEVANKIGPKLGDVIKKIANKKSNSWMKKLIDGAGKISNYIGEHQIPFPLKNKELESILAPKSVYNSYKYAIEELRIKDAVIDTLVSDNNINFIKLDKKGNIIGKEQLKKNGGNCILRLSDKCDEEIKNYFEKYGIKELTIKNGVVDQSPISIFKFKPEKGITSNREKNMSEYYKQLANDWKEKPSTIPEKIKNYLSEDEIRNLNSTIIKDTLSKAQITPHEEIDGYVYLVDSFIHGKISHYGGVALAEAKQMLDLISSNFERFSRTTAGSINGTLIVGVMS